MSWRIRIVHATGYRYDAPVRESYNELRLTPRSDGRQNVIVSRIETTPSSRLYRYDDYWGTAVTAFDLHAPHRELAVVATSVVETSDPPSVVRTATWAELDGEAVRDRQTEMLEFTTYVPREPALERIARGFRRRADPADAVLAACRWVREHLAYRPGSTGVHTSAVEAWQAGEGVCQDFVHLTLVLLRSVGIPCRYVSGYLLPRGDTQVRQTVQGQSHAWVEAWTGGWWAYDPTNDVEVGQQHVQVAWGRDYADVAPMRGVYTGGRGTALEVRVDMTRLA
ncbi:transglutaminase family protein [Pseudonocardia sp.]|uniref:transglutaminase family protein n=1 Tax=Pseudonocardia sp. TaxID=60912 RepID=UPI003D14DA36